MLRMIDGLENFIQLDIPFLMNERKSRVETLKSTMDRGDISTSEKFSSVFLSGIPADETVKLSWENFTPWRIESSLILKKSFSLDTVYVSSVEYNNIIAFQFHPEKSGEKGLNIFRNFKKIIS